MVSRTTQAAGGREAEGREREDAKAGFDLRLIGCAIRPATAGKKI